MALPSSFTIEDRTYIMSRPMSVPDQMHVARKLGPFLPRLPRVLKALDAIRRDDEERLTGAPVEPAAPPETPEQAEEAVQAAEDSERIDSGDKLVDQVLGSVEPLLQLFAEMREEDVNSVMIKCFRCVDRVTQRGMVPIWNSRAGDFQYEEERDLGIAAMICLEVVKASVGPFLRGRLSQFQGRLPR